MPLVSVVICTHNPRLDLLRWTFDSLAAQTPFQGDWELIVVDNRCEPPLDLAKVLPAHLVARTRIVRENRPGLTAARSAGIRAAAGELFVLVDDDNHLAPDYLLQAIAIANAHPEIGCFGGIAVGHFECVPPEWLTPLTPHLGIRNYGGDPIISRSIDWGPWEPIGAGMVLRRTGADAFVRFFESDSRVGNLGRTGNSLASCEDSLIAFLSLKEGFANSYQPSLRLVHFIKDSRVRPSYFARLLFAMGRSFAQLENLKGRPAPTHSPSEAHRYLADLLSYRLSTLRDVGYFQWLWDVGNMSARSALEWPSITIVVPTYNSGKTLRRTLESLKAQVYPNLEVVVQDGGSCDQTLAIVEEYRDVVTAVVSGPDEGQADAINRGLKRASGELRGWLCGDDEYRPGFLLYASLMFQLHPDRDFMVAGCLRVFPDGSTAEVRPSEGTFYEIGFRNGIDQPATLWRRTAQDRAGVLDISMHYAFDWEYWNRLLRHGAQPLIVKELLAVYYFSDSNKTSTAGSRQVPELARVVREYGPYEGRLARIYSFLYRNFDLFGCYDQPPSAPISRMRYFNLVLRQLSNRYGEQLIFAYNWTYASKQERSLVWYR